MCSIPYIHTLLTMASVGKGALCPGFAASIPGTGNQGDLLPTSPLETLKLLRLLTPLYTAVEGARSRRVKSWPVLSPCSTAPAWNHPAGWPEFCSHYGLLETTDGVISLGVDPASHPYRYVQLYNAWVLPEVTLLSVSRSRGTWELQPPTGVDWLSVAAPPGAKPCIPSTLPYP